MLLIFESSKNLIFNKTHQGFCEFLLHLSGFVLMSIALERNGVRIESGSGFMMSCKSSRFESKDSMVGIMNGGDRKFLIKTVRVEEEEKKEDELLDSSSSSSSIGRNSDCSERFSDDDDDDETEVQSSYKGTFDSMDSLEEVLPIKKGISRFYSGKSKSFTSLADASTSSSIKELSKPDNAYSKKRRNLLACSLILDKNRSYSPLRSNGGGISKRTINTSKSTLALGVAMSNSESENSGSPPRTRPPLHPQAKLSIKTTPTLSPPRSLSSWRSFSLTDLQCTAASNTSMNNSLFQ